MTRVGVFFGTVTGNTRDIAEAIRREFDGDVIARDISDSEPIHLSDFDLMILGTSTWNIGEMDEWDEFIGRLGNINTSETKFALFGLGDQDEYPDRFQDSLGHLYDRLRDRGAKIIGGTSAKEYKFTKSAAIQNGDFVGLALDNETEAEKTPVRIKDWVKTLSTQI